MSIATGEQVTTGCLVCPAWSTTPSSTIDRLSASSDLVPGQLDPQSGQLPLSLLHPAAVGGRARGARMEHRPDGRRVLSERGFGAALRELADADHALWSAPLD